MKVWFLTYDCGLEYAVVYAKNEKQALEKLFLHGESNHTNEEDKKYWKVEEFTKDTYAGVLFFS